jgi:putative ABC transport system substrate-binding protein
MIHVRRRQLVLAIGTLVVAPVVCAQQPAKVARIGYLSGATPQSGGTSLKTFTAGMQALGWSEGRNLAIEVRHTGARAPEIAQFAAELVQLKPDVIVSTGPAPTLALKQLGTRIPVVFVSVADPVGLGLVKSLGRPEGNFTGLATLAPEFILAKQIELLHETVPRASRIAFLTNPGNPLHVQGRELRLRVAKAQRLEVIEVEAASREALELAFAEAARRKADVMYLSGDPMPLANTEFVAELALRHRLPVMFLFHQHVDAGGLMSYGVDLEDLFRRAASYVDRILKGADPKDLPIEEPTRYLLVINLKTARALGLTIPQPVLLRAERVIE